MNERIRELAEQCYETGPLGKDGWPKWGIFNEVKFADLLLFECVKLAVFKGDSATALAIKEHFGLEEPKGWVCPKCGTDRTREPCPQGPMATVEGRCPMGGVAQ